MSYLTVIPTRELIRLYGVNKYSDNADSRHKMVMSLFPRGLGDNPRSKAKVLFRFERDTRGSRCIIRSSIAPASLAGVRTLEEKPTALTEGDYLAFRVVLSPVKRKRNQEKPITETELQEEWAEQKLPFLQDVNFIDIKDEVIARFYSKNSAVLQLVQFDGVAKVSNIEKLREAIGSGIGRSRSYGAGLLTVRKI